MTTHRAGRPGPVGLGLGIVLAAAAVAAAASYVARRLAAQARHRTTASARLPASSTVPAKAEPALRLARIVIPVANPATAGALVRLGAALGDGQPPADLVALKIVAAPKGMPLEEARRFILSMRESYEGALAQAGVSARELGITLGTELRVERSVAPGILAFAGEAPAPDLLLLGWRGGVSLRQVRRSINQEIVHRAEASVAVLRERELGAIRRILVPVGWGPHARFGLRLAERLALNAGARVTILRILPMADEVDWEEERAALAALVAAEAPGLSYDTELRLAREPAVVPAILGEARRAAYDLLVIGASDEWWLHHWLFGAIPDQVAERAPCSVLLVRWRARA